MNEERSEKLKEIRDEVLALEGSALADYRRENKYLPVLGEGSHSAEIMFVGEAPGENEAKTGRPFCGRSGKLLDQLLASIDLPRESVYITSIVKDRPPKNRDPKPEEIKVYAPFLDRQIEVISPKVIATLGRFGMEYIMKRYGLADEIETIGKIHGKVFKTKVDGLEVRVIPLYHPAAAIYNQELKSTLLEDFKVLKTIM